MHQFFSTGSNIGDSNQKLTPVKTYEDAGSLKKLILAENGGLSGVYRWVNNKTKKTYVGSGKDLKIRINCYYSLNMLKKEKRPICNALLKYGHNYFTLEILEYCPISKLIEREQYYLDLLKPEYNIAMIAYSTLGYKHSAETIALLKKKMTPEVLELLKQKKISPEHKEILSLTHKGKVVSEETRKKLAIATTRHRKKNPLSAEALANIKAKTTEREGVAVTVLNTETNETWGFTNQTEAGEFIGVTRQAVYNAIKRGKPIKGIYLITK